MPDVSTTTGRSGRALRGFLVLGTGNYLAMVVSFAINALLTRKLGATSFGALALLLSASQATLLVCASWTQSAIVRFGAQEFSSTASLAETFWTRTWLTMPALIVAATAVVAGHDAIAAYLGVPAWALWIVSAHFAAMFVQSMAALSFQARDEMSRYGALLVADKFVLIVLLLLLPLVHPMTPLAVLTTYAISAFAVAVGGLVVLGSRSLLPVVINREACRSMLIFAAPLILSSWVGLFGTNWFDLFILKRYRPLSEVGFYSLATLLAGVVQQVTVVFSTTLLPQFSVMVANGEDARIRTLLGRLLPYWFLATSLLFSVVPLVAIFVVPAVFGAEFARAVPVLATLMMAGCALALFNAFSPLVTAIGSTWVLTGVCFASGVVNVALDFALIPAFGVEGSAVATVAAYGTSAILVLVFVQRRLNAPVLGLTLLALPVVIVSVSFLLLEGAPFYVLAVTAGSASVLWLVRRFRLFREEDAVFLEHVRVLMPLARHV